MKKCWLLIGALCIGAGYVWAEDAGKPVEPALTGTALESGVAPADLKVTLKIGTGIATKEIDGENTAFPVSVGKVYCWSLIEGAQEPIEIKHQWLREGQLVSEVPLNVKYPRFRTWSYKTLAPELAGNWEVKIVDSQENVLGSLSFKVLPETETAPEVKMETGPKTESGNPAVEPATEPKAE
ncbi:MAG: DUF2914 domain-containing protein [Elusimicrobiota bacterium]